jgi:hypothetical protein
MKTAVPLARALVDLRRIMDELDGKTAFTTIYDQFDRELNPEGSDTVGTEAPEELGSAYTEAADLEAGNYHLSLVRGLLSYAYVLLRDTRYCRLNRRSLLYLGWRERAEAAMRRYSTSMAYAAPGELDIILEDPGNAPIKTNIPYNVP